MYSTLWGSLDDAHAKRPFNGRLDIRAPEDLFASEDQVRERYRNPVDARGIEESIASLLEAWQEGDRSRGGAAADEMERRTRDHFRAQGVPVFAHPIVPPQFVQAAHELISDLPSRDRSAALDDLVDHFTQNLRPGVAQELGLGRAQAPATQGARTAHAVMPAANASLLTETDREKATALVDDGIGERAFASSQAHTNDETDVGSSSWRRAESEPRHQPLSPFARSQPLAYLTPDGRLAGVQIETPGRERWTRAQRNAADETIARIARIGEGIEKFGTPEEKEAWRRFKRIVLSNSELRTKGVAENDNDVLLVDLNKMGRGGDPSQPVDERFIYFMLAHELLHSTASSRRAHKMALAMQGDKDQRGEYKIGTPQWAVEVRHDKLVYEFLVRARIIDPKQVSIKEIAPYYWEHLKNPKVPVVAFRGVPGYDGPID